MTKKNETESKSLNIYQRIRNVMLEVQYVQKENKKVNNQYTFVSHDAVSAALHEPLAKHGIVMIPNIEELRQEGNRTIVKMNISFVNIDNPEDLISLTYYGYGIDQQDKGIGKAVSYAVKYALLKTFCLETGDDGEKDNIDFQEETLTDEECFALSEAIDGDEELAKKLTNWLGVEFIGQIPSKKFQRAMEVVIVKQQEKKENKNDEQ